MNQKLYICDMQGEFVPAEGPAILAAAQFYLRNRVRRGASLESPAAVREYLTVALGDRDCEYFCVILLDSRHRVLRFLEMFRGTIDGASVYPREVVKVALEAHAAAVLLVHNHPSKIGEPSTADELITQRLRDALNLVDIRVLDHLIVAGAEVVSLAERGLI
jgi:DNA repair protein RadC